MYKHHRRDTEEGSPKDQREEITKEETNHEHKQDQRAGF